MKMPVVDRPTARYIQADFARIITGLPWKRLCDIPPTRAIRKNSSAALMFSPDRQALIVSEVSPLGAPLFHVVQGLRSTSYSPVRHRGPLERLLGQINSFDSHFQFEN